MQLETLICPNLATQAILFFNLLALASVSSTDAVGRCAVATEASASG